jgi:hypothetical protein
MRELARFARGRPERWPKHQKRRARSSRASRMSSSGFGVSGGRLTSLASRRSSSMLLAPRRLCCVNASRTSITSALSERPLRRGRRLQDSGDRLGPIGRSPRGARRAEDRGPQRRAQPWRTSATSVVSSAQRISSASAAAAVLALRSLGPCPRRPRGRTGASSSLGAGWPFSLRSRSISSEASSRVSGNSSAARSQSAAASAYTCRIVGFPLTAPLSQKWCYACVTALCRTCDFWDEGRSSIPRSRRP